MQMSKRQNGERELYGRAARRRKQSRKRAVRYTMLALFMMLCIAATLSVTVFFNAEMISVSGESRYASDDIIKQSGLQIGDNLFRIDTAASTDAITKAFPYISSARIKRALPDEIIISVEEAAVFAAAENDSDYILLAENGRILEKNPGAQPREYTRIRGVDFSALSAGEYLPESEQERFSVQKELLKLLDKHVLERISLIWLGDINDIWLLYDGRVAISFGGRMDMDYKIRAAKEIIALSVDSSTVGVLDVSSRAMMRMREENIYDEERWPFPAELCEDYRRVVPKKETARPQAQPNEPG